MHEHALSFDEVSGCGLVSLASDAGAAPQNHRNEGFTLMLWQAVSGTTPLPKQDL
jgi:hypothetical protein